MVRISKQNKKILCALNELTNDNKGIANTENISNELEYIRNVRNIKSEVIVYNNYDNELCNIILDDDGQYIIDMLKICNDKFLQKMEDYKDTIKACFDNPKWYHTNMDKLQALKKQYYIYQELENNIYHDIIKNLI